MASPVAIPTEAELSASTTIATPGAAGAWDERFAGPCPGSCILLDNGDLYLYYVGAAGDRPSDGGPANRAVGLLKSSDGGSTWTKDGNNPVVPWSDLNDNNDDEEGAWGIAAKVDGTDVILYVGKLVGSGGSVNGKMMLFTSSDGIDFDAGTELWDHANSSFPGNDEMAPVAAYEDAGGTWHLYYLATGTDVSDFGLIHATGTARDTWTSGTEISGEQHRFGDGVEVLDDEGGEEIHLSLPINNFGHDQRTVTDADFGALTQRENYAEASYPGAQSAVQLDRGRSLWHYFHAQGSDNNTSIEYRTAPTRAGKPDPWQLDASQVASTWDPIYAGNSFVIPFWEGSGEAVAYENPSGQAADEVTGADNIGDPSANSWIHPGDGPAVNPEAGGGEATWEFAAPTWLQDLPQGDHTVIVVVRNPSNTGDDEGRYVHHGNDGLQYYGIKHQLDIPGPEAMWDDDAGKRNIPATSDETDGQVHVLASRRDGTSYEIVVDGTQEGSGTVNNNFSVGGGPVVGGIDADSFGSGFAVDAEILCAIFVDSALSDALLASLADDIFGPITQQAAAGQTVSVGTAVATWSAAAPTASPGPVSRQAGPAPGSWGAVPITPSPRSGVPAGGCSHRGVVRAFRDARPRAPGRPGDAGRR